MIKPIKTKKFYGALNPNEAVAHFNLGIDFAVCHNLQMQDLRNSKLIAKLVLVWFALFLGSAVASTVLKSTSLHSVCSTGGVMKMVDTSGDEDGGGSKVSASMDCPLCATVAALPASQSVHFKKFSPMEHALQPVAVAHIASLTAPPLPSRGPPIAFL